MARIKDTASSAELRRRLESFRIRLFMRLGERGVKLLFVGLPIALGLTVALLLVSLLVPIKSIDVGGDVTMFNEGEIISAAEINEGDSLLLRSRGRIKRAISRNLPLAEDIRVKKSLSGRVSIEVEFADVDYYFKHGQYFYALSEDLEVLDRDESKSKYSSNGAVLVVLPEIREPRIGKKIVFFDTVEETDTEGETLYEIKDERYYAYVTEFLRALRKHGFHYDANGVILNEKFDLTLIYAQKFSVVFGSPVDLDVKFRVLFEILSEGSMQYADKVAIDLTTPSKATARADSTLDFSEFVD